jgi:ABC-2 type transport system ATP-binding protein
MADNTGTTMVEARSLAKSFGATQALRGVSFRVSKGEVLGFLGPNGAGKTTTMKILTGFLRPGSGQAIIGGIDVADDPLAARRLIGYLPENAPLYDDMMVIDFLTYVAELRRVPSDVLRQRLKTICERCGLVSVLGKDIGQLSKGFRQRVGLAQAMVHDPDLLILDEPTSGLDPNQIVEIRALIKDLGRAKTVILSTHILPEVQATCSRIVIINEGTLVADDTPEHLTEQSAGAVVRVVLRAKNGVPIDPDKARSVLSALPGIRAVQSTDGEGAGTVAFSLTSSGSADPREAIFSAAVSNGFVLLELHRQRVSLEDTFRRLTQQGGAGRAATFAEGGPRA